MKIENIPLSLLEAVRQRLGAKDENDNSIDLTIERLTPEELVAKWSGWHLGDEVWGRTIINYYNQLNGAINKEKE